MNTENYMLMPEVHNLSADSILADEAGNLVFGSFWCNDTLIRDFQGRLTLASQEGGMTSFNLIVDFDGRSRQDLVRISNIEHITQMTGREHTVIYGDLMHCYLVFPVPGDCIARFGYVDLAVVRLPLEVRGILSS